MNWNSNPVVFNLVGGTESHKFHTCIHWTLRSWKNKMFVVIFFFYFYCSKSLSAEPLRLTRRIPGFDWTQVKNHCASWNQKPRNTSIPTVDSETACVPCGCAFRGVYLTSISSLFKLWNSLYLIIIIILLSYSLRSWNKLFVCLFRDSVLQNREAFSVRLLMLK